MDKDKLFEIFMEHGANAVAAYHRGGLEEFLASKRTIDPNDSLGDFTDDEFEDPDEKIIWDAMISVAPMFNVEELKKLGDRFGFAGDHEGALQYATDIIKGRWPEVEYLINDNPHSAFQYAVRVIKGRWLEAEEAIKRNAWTTYLYAKSIIKERWPEAESVIVQNADAALAYTRDVIKGRWLEAESIIINDPWLAYDYAKNVIGGRWPEAENTIMRDSTTAYRYTRDTKDK